MKLILASYSRARAALLQAAGYTFSQQPSGINERPYQPGEDPGRYVEVLAQGKAEAVAARFPDSIILAADTCLYLDGKTYGKPADLEGAVQMLLALGGRTHVLVTGICVIAPEGRAAYSAHDTVHVTMRRWSEAHVRRHVAIAKPLPYAGAYALQGEGCAMIARLEGDPNTVIGLPLGLVAQLVAKAGGA